MSQHQLNIIVRKILYPHSPGNRYTKAQTYLPIKVIGRTIRAENKQFLMSPHSITNRYARAHEHIAVTVICMTIRAENKQSVLSRHSITKRRCKSTRIHRSNSYWHDGKRYAKAQTYRQIKLMAGRLELKTSNFFSIHIL